MNLAELLAGIDPLEQSGPAPATVEITGVAYDSRKVEPGGCFVALHGAQTDGNRFLADAIARGARAIVSEHPRPAAAGVVAIDTPAAEVPRCVAWVRVRNARKALAITAANFYHHPAEAVKLIGVTGTNGKTTTAFIIDALLRSAGRTTGLFGTIVHRTPRLTIPAKNTTPESLDLQSFFADVRDAGGTHATLEVSSHALAMDRVWACPFAVAVFTNLTRDHLDYHQTMEAYFAAKLKLFDGTGAGTPRAAVINTDDSYGRRLLGIAGRTLTYGLHNGADVTTKKYLLGFSGLDFSAETPIGPIHVRSKLVGKINVYNLLAAIGAGIALGMSRTEIESGIAQLTAVPGRFERVDAGQPFLVVVDYAHTDDALRNLLETARDLLQDAGPAARGRIITLFGCGGDRDRSKRPLMGEVAGSMSDFVVLTSDNPRTEDPLRILNDATVGLQKAQASYRVEADRERAIEIALREARAGDIVLLAGKGHETYQILKDRTIDFDDRDVARVTLGRLGFKK